MKFDEYKLYRGKGIKAVIIDSGLNLSNKAVKSEDIIGYSIENNRVINGCFDDHLGHGTAVYSLIYNIVPETEFIIFKIFDSDFFCSSDYLEMALEYIYNNISCDIINISCGTCILNSNKLYEICNKLYKKGVIILSAFDNGGAVSFPAAFDIVIGVDSSLACKTINDFEFVCGSEINIRAKAGMHRVAWTSPEYIFVEGNSFSIAYATAMTIKIMESGCIDFKCILEKFKNNSIFIYTNESNVSELYRCELFSICRAIVFPYCKEVDSLIRFSQLTNFKLVSIYDYRLSGKVGMNINKQFQFANQELEEFIIQDIEKLDWNDNFDTVILGHINRIIDMTKLDYKEYIFKKCIRYKKNLFMFDNEPKYNYFVNQMKAEKLNVYYPYISNNMVPKNRFGKMFRNSKPIVGIFGTSSHQGKYTIQLGLIKKLSNEYKLASIGTEPTALLFNMDFCYPMGYNSAVYTKSYDSVYLLNDMIYKLSQTDTDLILVCSQYATLPFDVANISMFTNNQYDFLMGTCPEAIILTINPFDDYNYIKRTIMFLESCVDSKVIAIVVFPVDYINDWSGFYGKKSPLANVKYLKIKNELESLLNIPVLNLNNCIDELSNLIIDYFS